VLEVLRAEPAAARPLQRLGYLVTTETVDRAAQLGQLAVRLEAIRERLSNERFGAALAVGAFGPLTDPEAILLAGVLAEVAELLVVAEAASDGRGPAPARTRLAWLRLLAKAGFGMSWRETARAGRRISAAAGGKDRLLLVFRDLRTAGRLRRAFFAAAAEPGGRRAAASAWRELTRPREHVREPA
jgi:hypothetical protein